jgi:glycosyltransferase involved in cell wall biosynthesis
MGLTTSQKILRIPAYLRRYGWSTAFNRGRSEFGKLLPGKLGRAIASNVGRYTPVEYFEAYLGEDQGTGDPAVIAKAPRDSITWVIPDFSPGSGGHTTILRIVRGLELLGWKNQTIVVQAPHRWRHPEDALASIRAHFSPLEHTRVVLGCENIPVTRFLLATGWQTAYWVAKFKDAAHRIYFVQDFEPSFYSVGTDHLFAEGTYKLGLDAITAGDWLKEKLVREYGMRTRSISFSCDHDIYKPAPRRPSEYPKQVFFYARPATPRRAFELGALALKRVCDARGDTAALLAGWDLELYDLPFPYVDAKVVSPAKLADMLSQSDAALVLSLTNLSLMPLEALSSGCPLVINDGPNNDWLMDESVSWYCDLNVDSIAETLMTVLDGGPEVEARRQKGLDLAKSTSWDEEFKKFSSYLEAYE